MSTTALPNFSEFCFPSKDSALFLHPRKNNNGFVEQNLKN